MMLMMAMTMMMIMMMMMMIRSITIIYQSSGVGRHGLPARIAPTNTRIDRRTLFSLAFLVLFCFSL